MSRKLYLKSNLAIHCYFNTDSDSDERHSGWWQAVPRIMRDDDKDRNGSMVCWWTTLIGRNYKHAPLAESAEK